MWEQSPDPTFLPFFKLPNQVHFAQCSASQNPDRPRTAAKRFFFHSRAKRRDWRTNPTRTPQKARAWWVVGYLWDEEQSSRAGRGMRGVGKGDWKKVQESSFCAGLRRLQASARGVFDPLTSKGHLEDTGACPVEGLLVPSSLDQLIWN